MRFTVRFTYQLRVNVACAGAGAAIETVAN